MDILPSATQQWFGLRMSERVLLCYFAYVGLLAVFFRNRPHVGLQPVLEFVCVLFTMLLLVSAERLSQLNRPIGYLRDWVPNVLLLVGFWEMEWFLPRSYPHVYEQRWQRFDHIILIDWHLRSAIESLRAIIPVYLETCYLLVYAVGPICLGILYALCKRRWADRFLTVYLMGTLTAYSLFPFFPSQPPRILFTSLDGPTVITWIRRVNLAVLAKGTIHIGVFPSAHVAAAFSAAWGFFLTVPERKIWGLVLILFALSVSIATVYGRYHYAADVLAGFAVSFAGVLFVLLIDHERNTSLNSGSALAATSEDRGSKRG